MYWLMMLSGAPPHKAAKWDGDQKCSRMLALFTWLVKSGRSVRAGTPLSEFTSAETATFGG